MRIERISVEGFGRLEGLELSLAPGLNVLLGPNEAGKSTLLAFIRAVLFGFEKRGSARRYEPGSGPFGGELALDTRLGPLRARRVAGRRSEGELALSSGDGAPVPGTLLEDALGGVSRELYFEVFAFGLDELSSFEALASHGSVSEALFTAGMLGAQRLPAALEALRSTSDALYVPRGSKPPLNEALAALDAVREELQAKGDRPAEYSRLSRRLSEVEEELRLAQGEAEAAERARAEAARLERVAPELAPLAAVEAELLALPELSGFPLGARERMAELSARIDKGRVERDARAAELAGVRAALERVARPLPIEVREGAARAALEAFRARAERLRELPVRAARVESKRRQVEEALAALGLPGSPAEFLALELGAAARGALEELREARTGVERALRDAEEALRAAATEHARALGELRRAEAELGRLPAAGGPALDRKQQALARIEPLRADLARLEQARRDRRAWLESYRAQEEALPEEAFPGWLAAAVGAGLLALALAALAVDARVGRGALGAAVLLGAVVVAIQRRAARGHRAQAEAHGERERRRRAEVARLSAELASLGDEERGRRIRLEVAAREAEVDPRAEPQALAALAQEWAALAQGARSRERREAEVAELRAGLERLGEALAGARSARDEAVARRERLAGELSAWLRSRRLPGSLSAERALALCTEAASVRLRLSDLDVEARALEVEEGDCGRASAELLAVARAVLGEELVEPEPAASGLAAALAEAEARGRERLAFEERQAALAAALGHCEAALAGDEAAARRLLAQAGCEDASALARMEEAALRHAELSQQARELRARIEAAALLTLAGARERISEAGGAGALAGRRAGAEAEVRRLAERLRALAEERGGLRARQDELARDGSVAELRAREEALRAQAQGLARRYAVERLALSLLQRAKQVHESEHQPRLLQLASDALSSLTGGRYVRARALAESRGLEVRDAQGRAWSAEQLSRGTREQLYLAFRLAVIRDFGEARAPLPVIVDDILVNFDPERTHSTVRALAELSSAHQVLAFTCHPHLAALLASAGARVLELPPSRRGA